MNDFNREFNQEGSEFISKADLKAPKVICLSPSKIADQFWCEMQLHLKMQLGVEPTEEMIVGRDIHRKLEEELGPIIEIIPTTIEDSILTFILQIYTKLETLTKKSITRELPVFGKINDFYCLGIIDQIKIDERSPNEKRLVISDYKTRKSKTIPSYEQKRRNRIQMQIYWFLMQQLIEGKFTKDMFKKLLKIPSELKASEQLLEQLPEELKLLMIGFSSEDLLNQIFLGFSNLPKLSDELIAIYLYQEDQTEVHRDKTFFHEESFEIDMEWALNYWKGERNPNECPQKWMCNFCQHTDKCHYFLTRYINGNERKK